MRFDYLFAAAGLGVGLVVSFFLYQTLQRRWSKTEKRAFFSTHILLGLTIVLGALCTIWAKSYVVYTAMIPLVLSLFCSGLAFWRALLSRREVEEAEDRKDLLSETGRQDLFNDTESVMKASEIARKQFDRWAVPAFTLLMGGSILLTSWAVLGSFRALLGAESLQLLTDILSARRTMDTLGFSVGFMLVCTLLGAYYNGISREPNARYMRPVGQWLFFTGILFAIATGLMGVEYISENKEDMTSTRVWDLKVAIVMLYVFLAFGLQMIFNFVMEFYRPRSGRENRPLYESRLLAIITEPGSVAANVSQTLEYQFGVSVSDTWFYRFLLKGALPYGLLLLVLLYSLDCFVYVRNYEMGVLMRFGAFAEVISPGLHMKLPRPFTHVRKCPVKRVNLLKVGFEEFSPEDEMKRSGGGGSEMEKTMGDPTGRVIVWSKQHFKTEAHYITAARSDSDETPGEVDEARAPVIDYLSASIAVYYKIQEDEQSVKNFFLNYKEPERVLKELVRRETVRYLASADLLKVISIGNEAAQKALLGRIRGAVDALPRPLGVTIVNFAMTGVHPPIEVAESFQNIITGMQEKKKLEHEAWSVYHKLVESAKGEHDRLISEAESYKFEKETVPQTEIAQFEAQLVGYRIAPEVFKMRYFLSEMEDLWESPLLWKFIVATPSATTRITDIRFKEPRAGIEDIDTEVTDE